MKISKLIIKNFKSYENIEFSDNCNKLNDVNLFIGSNASGKTNLIQVFEFLKLIKKVGINKGIMFFGGFSKLKNFNNQNNTISIEIEIEQNEKSIFRENSDTNIVKLKTKFSYLISLNNTESNKYDLYEKILFHELFILEDLEGNKIKDLNTELVYGLENIKGKFKLISNEDKIEKYYDNQELNLRLSAPFVESFIAELNSNYKNKSVLEYPGVFIPSNIFDFGIYDIDAKKAKSTWADIYVDALDKNAENLTVIINQIQKDENKENYEQFIADVAGILDFIEDIRVENFNGQLTLQVKEKGNKNYTESHLLSDGTISIIALIVALYYQENDIIIIEEPEHGVHPALISQFVKKLYNVADFYDKQIIITSQSSVILKNIYFISHLKDIFTIQRNKKNFSYAKQTNFDSFKDFLHNFDDNIPNINELKNNELIEFINEIGIENLQIQNRIK